MFFSSRFYQEADKDSIEVKTFFMIRIGHSTWSPVLYVIKLLFRHEKNRNWLLEN